METKHARHYLLTAFTIYEMLNNQIAVLLYASSMFKKYRYSLNSVCDATPRNGLSRIRDHQHTHRYRWKPVESFYGFFGQTFLLSTLITRRLAFV